MKQAAALAAFFVAFSLAGAALAERPTTLRSVRPETTAHYRSEARRWEALVGYPRAWTHYPLGSPVALDFWRRRLRAIERVALSPPHRSAWLCIHRYEGSWRDSGDPYWGGLQMDRGFMARYAPSYLLRRGLANAWTPLEQMWTAERALRAGRGFYPWPNTARYCGLI